MWQWFRAWLVRLGLLSPPAPPPAITAASALAELRAERLRPADDDEWQSAVRRFNTKVFGDADRARLWRRYRKKYDGELRNWNEISQPNTEDQACLDQILLDLAR
jgi:hypothetical protein